MSGPHGPTAARQQDEDALAVERVLAGDLSGFEGIVRRWQGRLVNLAWRFCRDRSLAEDLAQDAFVRAFKALRTFRGDSAFSTWLTAIALNTYRSGAVARLQQDEQAALVRRAVLTLPARYRDALVLYYLQENDLNESARVLGIPAGTLKARLHRGRELLKRRLPDSLRVARDGT